MYEVSEVFIISIFIITGFIIAKIFNRFKLPMVTGYLIAGLLLGPSFLNIFNHHITSELDYLSEIALGFIAFHIGENFDFKNIKRLGKNVVIITLFQAITTVLVVFITAYLFTKRFSFSIMLGAISAATAPAATLLVIKEFKCKGPLTQMLITVVALDDAVCLFIFSISQSIAEVFESGTSNILHSIANPLVEVVGSVVLGISIGLIFTYATKKIKSRNDLLIIVSGTILLGSGLSSLMTLSPLITCMSIGGIVANYSRNSPSVFVIAESITPPIYLLFFALAGIHLEFDILKNLGLLGIIYILSRAFGKIFGSYLGGVVTNSPDKVKKYLGFGLLPQAGVAIGLAMVVNISFPSFGRELSNLVMGAVFVYEIFGPILTKSILLKVGEVNKKND